MLNDRIMTAEVFGYEEFKDEVESKKLERIQVSRGME